MLKKKTSKISARAKLGPEPNVGPGPFWARIQICPWFLGSGPFWIQKLLVSVRFFLCLTPMRGFKRCAGSTFSPGTERWEGLIVEGWRKDKVLRCGRIAKGILKHCTYQSAEGLRKDFYTYRFWHALEYETVRYLAKSRKDRGSKMAGTHYSGDRL